MMINPDGKYAATVNLSNEFCVVEVALDRKVSRIQLDDISSITAHPKLPVVAYGNSFGYLFLLALGDPEQPSHSAKFYLTTNGIVSVKYSSNGQTIIAYTSDDNLFVVQVSGADI